MDITFKRVKISNFLSIGEAEVSLDNKGYVLIKGVNNCASDNAMSNGSGKSSIHDAILWALTGETSRGAKNVTNIFGDDGALVECEFDYGKDNCKVIRSKNHSKYGTNLKIYVNDSDVSGKGIRDSEKIFSELFVNLDTQLLCSVVLLAQGMPYRFSNNTPSKRKEMLEKLSQSDFMIEDVKQRIAKRKNEIEESIFKTQTQITKLNTQKEVYEGQILSNRAELESLNAQVDYDTIINTLTVCRDQSKRAMETTETTINLCEVAKVKQNNLLMAAIESINSFDEREDVVEDRKKLQDYRTKATTIATKATEVKRQYTMLDSVVDICPTCGQKLPNVTKIDTTDLHNEYNALKEEFDRITIEGSDLSTSISKRYDEFVAEKKQAQEEIKQCINKIDEQIASYKKNLTTYTNDYNEAVADIAKCVAERNNKKDRIDNLNNSIGELTKSIDDIEKELGHCDVVINNLTERKGIVTKMETLAKRDFRGYLLEGVITYIEKRAKVYCKDIFGTDGIRLALSNNDIDILYDGKEYELLSGGERQKIDIIIQLAIRDMLCALMGFNCNVIVFDEIFDFLDSSGAEALVKTISLRLQDINSIFIITHHNDIDIPYDNMITVVKDENRISHIE